MKKIFNKLPLIALVSGFLMVSSCGDVSDFGDTNVNPNATTIPVTSALLTNAISAMGGTARGITGGLYCQYFSETQYTDASLYALPTSGFGVYAGVLYDLENIINNNTDAATKAKVAVNGSNANQIAVARILKVFYYMYMTDQVGDIPYSGALKGEAKPIYDTQQAVYTGMFKELKEAAAQFDGGKDVVGDVLYGGDSGKWKKFANSMRLILALRISKADATTGKAEAASAIAGGVIQDNADNATLAFPGGPFKNPWFSLYDGRKDYAISDVVVTAMTDLKDARLKQFGNPNASGTVVGFPYGLTRDDAVTYANGHADYGYVLNAAQRKEGSPQPLLTAAHAYLARAEAAQRGWTTENVTTMYNTGIKASLEQWGVYVAADYNAYIADAKVSLAADPLIKIGTQRWMAFFPDGTQGWSEWRRTGYPVLKPTVKATNSSKQIPRRFVYPATEGNLNKDNYNAAVGRLSGGDTQDAKIWWDK
jgi:hypothetical protein